MNTCEDCGNYGYYQNGYQDGKADAIDDVIKKLAESEDTILTDKQYYTLMGIKEQKNE